MNDIIFWLDAQIAEAKRMEKELDEMEKHNDALYWYGRWKALWDVKTKLEK